MNRPGVICPGVNCSGVNCFGVNCQYTSLGGGGGMGSPRSKSWKLDFEITGDPTGPPYGSLIVGCEAPDS